MAKAIVIGAGFGGIAAASSPASPKGTTSRSSTSRTSSAAARTQYRRETPLGTFVHDAGPTVITAKFLFDELFELFGKRREDYVEFRDILSVVPHRLRRGGFTSEARRLRRMSDLQTYEFFVFLRSLRATNTFDYGGTLEQMEARDRSKFEPKDVEGFRQATSSTRRRSSTSASPSSAIVPFDQPFTTMLKCAPDLIRLAELQDRLSARMAKVHFERDRSAGSSAFSRCWWAGTRSTRRASTRSSSTSNANGACSSRWAGRGRSSAGWRS